MILIYVRKMATSSSSQNWLKNLKFVNTAIKELPVDDSDQMAVSRQVPNAVFSKSKPAGHLVKPQLVSVSKPALEFLSDEAGKETFESLSQDQHFIDVFCGKHLTEGSEPHSHCYCGHQFGVFAGQLGDGTNCYLGEIEKPDGSRIELQLKGSGPTPYSRNSDGKKVLRSSIREYLGSEHMHALGIPTTRSASIITSFDTKIERHDHARIFNQTPEEAGQDNPESVASPLTNEPAAVISRLAPTFLRFGSFEIVKSDRCDKSGKISNNPEDGELLDQLVSYTVRNFFNGKVENFPKIELDSKNYGHYQKLLDQATILTAQLVAKWRAFGFCHGVLNTDNMSILGLTIDYGPFGFMDYFDEDYLCNYSDHYGRYSFRQQKDICLWNLKKLESALNEGIDQPARDEVVFNQNLYLETFDTELAEQMRLKLGLKSKPDSDLLALLFESMSESRSDFVSTFLLLEQFGKDTTTEKSEKIKIFKEKLAKISQKPKSIESSIQPMLHNQQLIQVIRMSQVNKIPVEYILGPSDAEFVHYQIKRLIKMQELMSLDEQTKYDQDLKIWEKFLTKYSEFSEDISAEVYKNPKVLLKNYLAQEVILAAEAGDFQPTNDLLAKLLDPLNEKYNPLINGSDSGEKCLVVPNWAEKLCVSCSS